MSNFSQIPQQPFGPPQPPGYHQPPPPPGFSMQYGAPPQQPPYAYQPVPQQFGPPPPMQGFAPGGYPGVPPQHLPPAQPVIWMQRPNPIPGVPPGLEYLTQIDNLQIEQKASLLEAFTGWDTNNKYVIMNGAGAQVYYACEETDTCMRICCSTRRAFKMHILDNFNNEVMRVTREFKCCAGCCWFAGCCECCAYEVQVEAPAGNVIGYVKQSGSFFKPCYSILDENHQTILKLEGPFCILDGAFCPFDNNFKLKTLEGNEIGVLKKMYAGFVNEYVTTADRFGINFPLDLSVKVKACLLGAMFLIDFMFFENPPNSN